MSKRKLSSSFRSLKKTAHGQGPYVDHHDVAYLKKHVHKLWEYVHDYRDRLQNLEILMDLSERLIVSLALHRLGMRLSELRRMIRQAEKEALAESEVHELEELFNKPARKPAHKKSHRKRKS